MIIVTGVAGPSGRQAERVCKGSAPSGHCPMTRLLVGVPSRARVLGLSACGPRQPLTGLVLAGARQLEPPAVSVARSPAPLRVCGGALRQDPLWPVSGSADHHGSSPSVGVTWRPETKKPTRQGGLFRVHLCTRRRSQAGDHGLRSEFIHLLTPHQVHLLRLPHQWPSPLAPCRICMDWIQEMLPCRCEGRAERGDSAHGPIAQRRTPAQIHTQAGMRKQA